MFLQAAQQFHNVASPQAADPDTHAHSPRRRNASMAGARLEINPTTGSMSTALYGIRHPALQNNDPFWSQHGPPSDPFTGGANLIDQRNQSSRNTTVSSDVPMKDRSRSTSDGYDESMPDATRPPSSANSRRSHPMPDFTRPQSLASSRKVSWCTGEDSNAMKAAHLDYVDENFGFEEQAGEGSFSDLIARMSPRDFSASSGISAPSNTRVNSAANTPPGKASTAAELRAASYAGMLCSVSVTTRDPPPHFNTRAPPSNTINSGNDNARAHSGKLETHDEASEETEEKAKKRPIGRPTGNVKSRKEGRTSEMSLEPPGSKSRRRATAPSASASASALGKENSGGASDENYGEGKRKRGTNINVSKVIAKDRLENPDSSPTRKHSKLNQPHDEIKYVLSHFMLLVFDQDLSLERCTANFTLRRLVRGRVRPLRQVMLTEDL